MNIDGYEVKPLFPPDTPEELIEAELDVQFALMELSRQTLRLLLDTPDLERKQWLYRRLLEVNEHRGVPTDPAWSYGLRETPAAR